MIKLKSPTIVQQGGNKFLSSLNTVDRSLPLLGAYKLHILISMPVMVIVDDCAVSSINCSITTSDCRSRKDCFQKESTPLEPSLFADIRHLIFLYLQAFSKFCRDCCLERLYLGS